METADKVLSKALKILEKYPLCDYCLGRQFAALGYGVSNAERGRAIKTMLLIEGHRLSGEGREEGVEILSHLAASGFKPAATLMKKLGSQPPEEKPCYICEGFLNRKRFEELAKRIIEELRGYEFKNFVVGARIPAEVREREDILPLLLYKPAKFLYWKLR